MPEHLRISGKKAGVGDKARRIWRRGFEMVKNDVRDVMLRI
jgi:hypothetical protein